MASSNLARAVSLTRLPSRALTRSGLVFNPRDDVWQWVDGVFSIRMDFSRLSMHDNQFVESLKYTLHILVRSNAPTYALNLFNEFLHFLRETELESPVESIGVEDLSSYRARLAEDEAWRVGWLNVLIQKWVKLGLPGVRADCAEYLRERRKPGNAKGRAVRQSCPVEGPYSDEEYVALYRSVDAAYGQGKIPLWVLVLTRLLFATGGRISQLASLKVKDFTCVNGSYLLKLPQVKNGLDHSRESFTVFPISHPTARLVLDLIESRVDCDAESALFLQEEVMWRRPRRDQRAEGDPFFGHCTQQLLSRIFSRILSSIAPLTSRLDFEKIPINPRRFRYTYGTRLAEEGASKAEIADRLGHADLQNVDVYFEASPGIVDNIDHAMGEQLAPLARAFRGRMIDAEEQATQAGRAGSRIIDFRVSSKPLASCSAGGRGCALNKPVACYTCFRFEPWLDGPHELVLARLERERDQWAADPRMAAINDLAIMAIREVIADCAHVRKQRDGGVAI
ncbi:site-specific integrase [Stenotrophomonas sp.]|uniref:site-specific integrase n=1 Tax=Stenotrophomonas sp. TaxID=69392 RepID=UPI0025F181C7|nr:site-specific integrase [Stenotrophomonas sp.]